MCHICAYIRTYVLLNDGSLFKHDFLLITLHVHTVQLNLNFTRVWVHAFTCMFYVSKGSGLLLFYGFNEDLLKYDQLQSNLQ